MADPMAAWLGFLASTAAPKTAISPLELDGYLTGIVVAPQAAPILPSEWLPGLWGIEEPIFDDDAQIKAVLGAVIDHYNTLIAARAVSGRGESWGTRFRIVAQEGRGVDRLVLISVGHAIFESW